METFELKIKNDSISGVFAVGLVDRPAIQQNWVALSENIQLFYNQDKQELIGPLMIPNQLIYRADSRGEYNVFFTEDTIKSCQEKFFKAAFNSKTTHNHLVPLQNNTVLESWIVEDSDKDKSNLYGFNLPVGTWMIKVKVNDKEYWDNYVKTNKVNGFSLEGFFDEVKIDLNMQDKVKKFAAMPTSFYIGDINVEINDKNELVIVDVNAVMPEGEYETKEGYCICVNAANKVTSIKTPEYEEYEEVYVEDTDEEYFSEVKLAKNKPKVIKKLKKNKNVLSQVLNALGFKFEETQVETKIEEQKMAETIKQEIEFPIVGGEIVIETDMGKFKAVITPIPAEPAADVADSTEPVASPTAEVTAMQEQIKELTAMVKTLMKSAPAPAKFNATEQKFTETGKANDVEIKDSSSIMARVREMKKINKK